MTAATTDAVSQPLSAAGTHAAATPAAVTHAAGAHAAGAHDFDFWMGSWNVHNRRLRKRLEGCTEWEEFAATVVAKPILGGLGNEDEFRTDHGGGFIGMTFRFFNPATGQWAIYWADGHLGILLPPVFGQFSGDTATFVGDDVWQGRAVRVRFIWSRVGSGAPRWEQAFSADGGESWETNWTMDMTPAGA